MSAKSAVCSSHDSASGMGDFYDVQWWIRNKKVGILYGLCVIIPTCGLSPSFSLFCSRLSSSFTPLIVTVWIIIIVGLLICEVRLISCPFASTPAYILIWGEDRVFVFFHLEASHGAVQLCIQSPWPSASLNLGDWTRSSPSPSVLLLLHFTPFNLPRFLASMYSICYLVFSCLYKADGHVCRSSSVLHWLAPRTAILGKIPQLPSAFRSNRFTSKVGSGCPHQQNSR